MFFPEYKDMRSDVECARVTEAGASFDCMGCMGHIGPEVPIIDMRAGWICHNDPVCYSLMKSFGETHGDRLMKAKEEIEGREI